MNVVGIGTDLVDCARIARMLEKHSEGFRERVFTAAEQSYCGAGKAAVQHFSGRWAAKEAILKALGTGWARGILWTDLEVINEAGGKPIVRLHGQALTVLKELGGSQVLVSISHTETQAVAFAMVVR